MRVAHTSTSLNDFVYAIKHRLEYFDAAVFNQPFNVEIASQPVEQIYPTVCEFIPKRPILKYLGAKGQYIIYAKNACVEKIRMLPYAAACCAAHEVRHRFQTENTDTLISLEFLLMTQLIPEDTLKYLYLETMSRYPLGSVVFNKEFDACTIEHLIMLGYTHPNFSLDTIVQLVKCNEDNLEDILHGITNPGKRYESPEGLHRHKCRACGHVWEHGNSCFNQDKEHQCPKCNREEWVKYFGHDAPTP